MYPDEAKLKAAVAEQQKCNANNAGYGTLGVASTMAMDGPAQDPLIDRVRRNLRNAARQAGNAERMNELVFLLEKNPEVARILDLLGINCNL